MISKDKVVAALRQENDGDLGTLLAFVDDSELGRWTTIQDNDNSKIITSFVREKRRKAAAGAEAGPNPGSSRPGVYADNSAAVAQVIVAGLALHERPPTTAAALQVFMEQSLGGRLPLNPIVYARLSSDPTNHRVLRLVEATSQAYSFSATLFNAITTRFSGASETSRAMEVAAIVDSVLARLQALTGLLPHRSDHDKSYTLDTSGATRRLLRPDFCVWVDNTLVFKGEEKASSQEMHVAVEELASKMGHVWSPIAFGNLPYLPCYAAAGSQLQFYVVLKEQLQQPVSISKRFDLSVEADRVEAVHATVNLFRLLCALRPLLPLYPVAVGDVLRRPHGTTITILTDRVIKEIKDFASNNNGVKYDDMANVYSATCNAAGLIHAIEGPTFNERRGTYTVSLAPLGHRRPPANEGELRQAIQAVLRGAAALHEAGYVHRDIRWDNVLRIGQDTWVLTDLESAARAPARRTESSFHGACWTDETVDASGTYTTASDVQLVGRLMETCSVLAVGAECVELKAQLMAGVAGLRPSAAAALNHRWFSADLAH